MFLTKVGSTSNILAIQIDSYFSRMEINSKFYKNGESVWFTFQGQNQSFEPSTTPAFYVFEWSTPRIYGLTQSPECISVDKVECKSLTWISNYLCYCKLWLKNICQKDLNAVFSHVVHFSAVCRRCSVPVVSSLAPGTGGG